MAEPIVLETALAKAKMDFSTADWFAPIEQGAGGVAAGSQKADQAGTALREILAAVEATVEQTAGITAAAQHMAESSRSVMEAMEAVSAVEKENTASKEEMAAHARQVREIVEVIAGVASEQRSTTVEVSSSAAEMSNQVADMRDRARTLAHTADELKQIVASLSLAHVWTGAERRQARMPAEAVRRRACGGKP